ncbi:unnamed protein product [Mucor circinelloides]
MASRQQTSSQQGKTYQFKLVLLGESAVGKSSLVMRFVKDHFDEYRESTIGAAFLAQTVTLDDNTIVKFEIWDTAGQERYKSLAPMYYRNANCAVVVYDITQAVSGGCFPVTWSGVTDTQLVYIVFFGKGKSLGE